MTLVDKLRNAADAKGISMAQLAIAWVLAPGDYIGPLTGARRLVQLEEALGSLEVSLTVEDLAYIETTVPINAAAGHRYPSLLMANLDSEKP